MQDLSEDGRLATPAVSFVSVRLRREIERYVTALRDPKAEHPLLRSQKRGRPLSVNTPVQLFGRLHEAAVIESVNAHYTGTALTAFTSRGQPIRSRRN